MQNILNYLPSSAEGSESVTHPLNAFALMKRTAKLWPEAAVALKGTAEGRKLAGVVKPYLQKFPVFSDFEYGAHVGLAAVQNYNDLDMANFTAGIIKVKYGFKIRL